MKENFIDAGGIIIYSSNKIPTWKNISNEKALEHFKNGKAFSAKAYSALRNIFPASQYRNIVPEMKEIGDEIVYRSGTVDNNGVCYPE